jgi:hypothetical protein
MPKQKDKKIRYDCTLWYFAEQIGIKLWQAVEVKNFVIMQLKKRRRFKCQNKR